MTFNRTENVVLGSFVFVDCTGSGARQLLQGQTSVDIAALHPGDARFFTLCNAKGRMLANGIVLHPDHDRYRLLVDQSVSEMLLSTLKRYAPFYQAALSVSEKRPALLARAYGCCLPFAQAGALYLSESDDRSIRSTDDETQWLACMAGYGVMFIDHQEVAQFLPSDLAWDRFGVSFSKGCYTGQEVIARVHYRGKPKSTLFLAQASRHHQRGAPLVGADDRNCGTLLRCYLRDNDWLLLAHIRIDALKEARLDEQIYSWYYP